MGSVGGVFIRRLWDLNDGHSTGSTEGGLPRLHRSDMYSQQ
ncbi:hypothetical protein SALBM135S_02978 [Streptomyces alboniger]